MIPTATFRARLQAWYRRPAQMASGSYINEAEFLPAAIEIIERPVSPTARLTAWALIVGLLIIMAWLFLGKTDVIASAPGRTVPDGNIQLIQSPGSGVIRAIHVRNGRRVQEGQVLVELDPTVSDADEAQAAKALTSAEMEIALNRAVLSALDGGAPVYDPPDNAPPELVAIQHALLISTLRGLESRMSGLIATRDAARAERAAATEEYSKLEEGLPLIEQQLEAHKQLLAKGYTPKLKVIELERQRLGMIRDRNIAYERRLRAAAELLRADQQISQARQEARRAILAEISKAEVEAILKREELVKARQRSRLQKIRAPISGTVEDLQIYTIGGVVEPARPVMTIVPEDREMVIEANILNRDSGFVRTGQHVNVKLEAFPFTKYGTITGRVEHISMDATSDEALGLVYPARIRLNRSWIMADGQMVALTSGMQVTVDIRTGKRRLVEYLVSPLTRAAQEAGRER